MKRNFLSVTSYSAYGKIGHAIVDAAMLDEYKKMAYHNYTGGDIIKFDIHPMVDQLATEVEINDTNVFTYQITDTPVWYDNEFHDFVYFKYVKPAK